ncbi:MAG: hypothetical protein BIFFINMI_01947 [Phycisphaerae bacterium]|nr:hypothetical protein [Phycisphaerae bacterium]
MSKPHRPWWRDEGILDLDHQHEPLAFIYRRGGGLEPAALEARTDRQFSEQWVKEHALWGNFLETCFFKGFGLEFEAEEMARTKRFIEHCHRYGLRVGVYTQWGSLFNETFFQEVPQAREWVQIGVDGRPIEYEDRVNQYYRWRGCPGNPDFLDYIRKVVRVAIDEFNVDVVYFDNMCLFEYHDTLCYCEHCQRGFREHLAAQYPDPAELFRRMGLRDVRGVYCPPLRPWRQHTEQFFPLKDPMIQEFVEFRCRQFADAWQAIYEFIQSVNPSVGLMGNPSFPRKYNERLTGAIDLWMLRRTPAIYYMENAVRNIGVRNGAVVSNIRGYRYGRALGENVTFVPCGGSAVPGLTLAECLAFNDGRGKTGCNPETDGPMLEFYHAHREEFYRDVAPAAEVAVLRHDVSLTWRWHEAFTVMELAQQQLLAAGIPWMPIWEHQLDAATLSGFKALVVPGCACVSREQADSIARFANAGGGVVVLENAGTWDECHRMIERWRFADLFGLPADHPMSGVDYVDRGNFTTFARAARPIKATVGSGRAIYLPQIRHTREPVLTYAEIGGYDSFMHLRLGRNWRALPRAVGEAAGGLTVTVQGPATLAAELLAKDGGRLLLHLVNYDRKPAPAGAVVRLGRGVRVTEAMLYTLPRGGNAGKRLAVVGGKGRNADSLIRLPAIQRYALAVLDRKGARK